MARLDRDRVVAEALGMLDELGLARISTRRLAQRLEVEQPALYWHFRNKSALLDAAMRPHAQQPLPVPGDNWRAWFTHNMRSFRQTLLLHRDGARLHAGSRPRSDDAHRVERKIEFLVVSGFSEEDAAMALLGAGRFTLGSVLDEQADQESAHKGQKETTDDAARVMPDHSAAFEAGLEMFVQGFEDHRLCRVDG